MSCYKGVGHWLVFVLFLFACYFRNCHHLPETEKTNAWFEFNSTKYKYEGINAWFEFNSTKYKNEGMIVCPAYKKHEFK